VKYHELEQQYLEAQQEKEKLENVLVKNEREGQLLESNRKEEERKRVEEEKKKTRRRRKTKKI